MTVVLLQLSVSLAMLLPVLQAAHSHAPSLAKRGRVGEGALDCLDSSGEDCDGKPLS